MLTPALAALRAEVQVREHVVLQEFEAWSGRGREEGKAVSMCSCACVCSRVRVCVCRYLWLALEMEGGHVLCVSVTLCGRRRLGGFEAVHHLQGHPLGQELRVRVRQFVCVSKWVRA